MFIRDIWLRGFLCPSSLQPRIYRQAIWQTLWIPCYTQTINKEIIFCFCVEVDMIKIFTWGLAKISLIYRHSRGHDFRMGRRGLKIFWEQRTWNYKSSPNFKLPLKFTLRRLQQNSCCIAKRKITGNDLYNFFKPWRGNPTVPPVMYIGFIRKIFLVWKLQNSKI